MVCSDTFFFICWRVNAYEKIAFFTPILTYERKQVVDEILGFTHYF